MEPTTKTTEKERERKFAEAEGLLNHIEDHLTVHGGKLRMSLIDDIVRYSQRIYDTARQDERDTLLRLVQLGKPEEP